MYHDMAMYQYIVASLTCVHYIRTSNGVLGLTFKSSIKYVTIFNSPSRTAICIGCLPSYKHSYDYSVILHEVLLLYLV